MAENRFPKSERLCGHLEIQRVFKEGANWKSSVLKAFMEQGNPSGAGLQVAFLVPSRRFRKATDRNRIKRIMRESYRLTRPKPGAQMPPGLVLFLFTGSRLPLFTALKILFEPFWKENPHLQTPPNTTV